MVLQECKQHEDNGDQMRTSQGVIYYCWFYYVVLAAKNCNRHLTGRCGAHRVTSAVWDLVKFMEIVEIPSNGSCFSKQ